MPAELVAGMDHDLYPWSAIETRPQLRWPNGKAVGFSIVFDVSSVTAEELTNTPAKTVVSGGLGPRPFPDIPRVSHREYGHRVGIFRLVEAAERFGVPLSVSIDLLTAEQKPYLARYCAEHAGEILAGGLSGSSLITSLLSEEEERDYVLRTLDGLEKATGRRPTGWMSPDYSQSTRTIPILGAAGVRHVLDWVNDDQPYALTPPSGDLYSVPVTYELDDVNALWQRRVDPSVYEGMLGDALDWLIDEGRMSGRSMVLRLRPWLSGQPFRIGIIERFLARVSEAEDVWTSTPAGLADAARAH